MPILARFQKQPAERQDYDIDFTDYLAALADEGESVVTTVEPGITLVAYSLNAGVVKVWLEGGTDGQTYKVTTTLTTRGGRAKQAEIKIKVKEY